MKLYNRLYDSITVYSNVKTKLKDKVIIKYK